MRDPPLIEQMSSVQDELQDEMNQDFLAGKYRIYSKFAEGDVCVCLNDGWYRCGLIKKFWNMTAPETIFAGRADVPIDEQIVTYLVEFPGYLVEGGHTSEIDIPENEIIPSVKSFEEVAFEEVAEVYSTIFGLLYAHEYNSRMCEVMKMKRSQAPTHIFFLDLEEQATLELHFKEHRGKDESFAQFCGREAELTYVNQ